MDSKIKHQKKKTDCVNIVKILYIFYRRETTKTLRRGHDRWLYAKKKPLNGFSIEILIAMFRRYRLGIHASSKCDGEKY